MDKNEKLAVARKKLKKFQSRNSQKPSGSLSGDGASASPLELPSSRSLTVLPRPPSESPTPPLAKNVRLSSAKGLREISQEVSSLFSHGSFPPPTSHASPLHSHSDSSLTTSTPLLTNHLTPPTAARSLPSLDGDRTALEKQVQVHAQTIDILVSEKSALQRDLSSLTTRLQNKTNECGELSSQLQAAKVALEEKGRERLSHSEELAWKEKALSQSSAECVRLQGVVERLQGSLEDQQQENTELISKITSHAAELTSLQTSHTDLQSRLNMAELLTQQLSEGAPPEAPPPGPTPSMKEVEELRGEVERMRGSLGRVTRERDQALSDLAALRDTLMHHQEDTARKMAELQGRLVESEVQSTSLQEELQALTQERETLLQRVATEHAQMEHLSQVAMETLQQERDDLSRQLQQQVQDNAYLTRLNLQQEYRVQEVEDQLSRLQETAVDQQSLLATISQDKETISRAMSQNKELKAHLAELQDAFVRLSQQNMELASDLETSRHRVGQLEALPREAGQDAQRVVEASVADSVPMATPEEDIGTDQEGSRDQIQALLEELHRVKEEHSGLCEEHERVLQQLNEVASMQEEPDFVGPEVEATGLSAEEVTALQRNFNALQQRFMAVMSEKADLLDQLQEYEHTIVQLAGETETIGEYVALYQTQREALREKFQEKEQFIQQLVGEKTAMQTKLHELHSLMGPLLAERLHTHPPSAFLPPSSPPDIPLHLRTYVPASREPLPPPEVEVPGKDTVGQVLELLDQLAVGGGAVVATETLVHCPCCTGQVLVV